MRSACHNTTTLCEVRSLKSGPELDRAKGPGHLELVQAVLVYRDAQETRI